MKKIIVIATTAFLVTGMAFAHEGDKKTAKCKEGCCKDKKECKMDMKNCKMDMKNCKMDMKKDAKTTTQKAAKTKA
jgi:hypothetical protein